jgi:hypothetical protein
MAELFIERRDLQSSRRVVVAELALLVAALLVAALLVAALLVAALVVVLEVVVEEQSVVAAVVEDVTREPGS